MTFGRLGDNIGGLLCLLTTQERIEAEKTDAEVPGPEGEPGEEDSKVSAIPRGPSRQSGNYR